MRCSDLAITLTTSIRFARMTPIRKALFGAHAVAIELRSVRLVSSPKIRCFPCQNPNFRFFLPFMVTFRLLFMRWFWARFGPDFRQTIYFISYFVLLGFLGFCYFWQNSFKDLIFSYLSPACERFRTVLLLLIIYRIQSFLYVFGVNFLFYFLQSTCWLACRIITILFRRHHQTDPYNVWKLQKINCKKHKQKKHIFRARTEKTTS
jgi:hypothetical protein